MNPQPIVAITIATYLRPEGLSAVLSAVVPQAEALTSAAARVIVIDNDPQASATEVVTPWSDRVSYVHEPQPGIAAARNRGLQAAREAGAAAVVFIDDDEIPDEAWLERLVGAWLEWSCAGVQGPVEYEFDGPPDPWVEAAGTFARLRHPSGSVVTDGATNNLLLDLPTLDRHGIRFDPAYGLTGGSDSMLVQRLVHAGEQIRWCDEAVVSEAVPAQRAQPEWILKRSTRTSNAGARIRLTIAPSPSERARLRGELLARGLSRIARGSVHEAIGRARKDVRRQASGAVQAAGGRGVLKALAGVRHVEYRRSRGV